MTTESLTATAGAAKALHWLKAVNGSFQTAADWTGGAVPGATDAAVLDAAGAADYTVSVAQATTVASLQTSAHATLDIEAGTFTATSASGSGADAGTIVVADAAILVAGGAFDNTGALDLLGTAKGADLQIGAGGLTLSGGGHITLADSLSAPFQPCPPEDSLDRVTGAAGTTLTNVDNTIAGAGWIGLDGMNLTNQAKGVIDASLVTDLILDRIDAVTNTGLLEATGAGGLYIVYSTVHDAGGVIAAAGGMVYLSFDDVVGGTFTSSGSGYIYTDHGPTILDGASAGAVTNKAYFFVSGGATLTLEGAIDNLGEFEVSSGSLHSSLIAGAGGATLSGGGTVVLEGTNPATEVTGATAAATLTNVDNTLSGQGQIGAGSLTLINEAGGIIDADRPASLTLDTGAAAVVNAGVIEATGRGQLIIEGTVNDAGGGRIAASSTARVTLQAATIEGGTITLTDRGAAVALLIGAGATTLTGAGRVTLSDEEIITGASAAATLDNAGDTIVGSGQIGAGELTLINGAAGVIEADGAKTALTIDTGAATLVNAGLIEATGAGATITGAVASSGVLKASGGDLTVDGAVSGAGRAIVAGGTLRLGAAFDQNVAFEGAGGVLYLAEAVDYAGSISGFSTTGSQSLDLGDIGFVSAHEAKFSGTTSGGVLTVTDGTHTARITLTGDYLSSSFVASSDGHGGVIIVDPPAGGAAGAVHRFIAAAAGLGGGRGGVMSVGGDAGRGGAPMLARPAVA